MMQATVLLAGAVVFHACSPSSSSEPATPEAQFAPAVSIRELMTYIIDPMSDNVFDAVAVDVTDQGAVETVPTTDDDWAAVMRGAVSLAEGMNLLKIPRRVAPPDDNVAKNPGELPPADIEARIEQERALFNDHADRLREEALQVMEIVRAKDASKLFDAGTRIDEACESCHLEFWYPGDREAVERDRNSTVTVAPPSN